MTVPVRKIALLSRFRCIGDACEDTCCQGWGMQVDDATLRAYAKVPELATAVQEEAGVMVMQRDPSTDFCVRFEGGWCGVQARHGEPLLGDACHFYPRVPREVGDVRLMSAALSCPEVVRLALYHDDEAAYIADTVERWPHAPRTYTDEALDDEGMVAVHQAFLAACDDTAVPVGHILRRLAVLADSLPRLAHSDWPSAVPFLLRMADGRMTAPTPMPHDAYRILQGLGLLVYATQKPPRLRLQAVIGRIEEALGVRLDWSTMAVTGEGRAIDVVENWKRHGAKALDPVLRRWLKAQLSETFFPHGGLGADIRERTIILAVRYATVALALASEMKGQMPPSPEDTVRSVQTLARFLNHLSDPQLSLSIYTDVGWTENDGFGALVSLWDPA